MSTNLHRINFIFIICFCVSVLTTSQTVFAQDGMWSMTGSMNHARRDHFAVLLDNGKVLIVGGTAGTAELYDPDTGVFSLIDDMALRQYQGVNGVKLLDGRVLIFGGRQDRKVQIYNPVTNSSVVLQNQMHAVREWAQAILLNNGKVLLVGGKKWVGGMGVSLATAELFNPVDQTFTMTGMLNQHRGGPLATQLPDGQVLIIGGNQVTNPGFAKCPFAIEIYNPVNERFDRAGNMNLGGCVDIWSRMAPLLSNNKIFIPSDYRSQLYDIATQTFLQTSSTELQAIVKVATQLQDGKILLTGGVYHPSSGNPYSLASAERYDHENDVFLLLPYMMQPRSSHTATLLADGRVLVVGGYSTQIGSDHTSAEIYDPTPSPLAILKGGVDQLQDLATQLPGSTDKIEDALAKSQTVLEELAKEPPDQQAAMGNIEGVVGELEAMISDEFIGPALGKQIASELTGAARILASLAIETAIDSGGDQQIITDANALLADGDNLRAAIAFKDAVNKYKDALAKAESSLS